MTLTTTNTLLFSLSLLFIFASACCRERWERWSLLFLTVGGFFLYFMAAQLFPYLNLWDEQYHALVAKNCMEHPFLPMMYNEAVVPGHDYSNWCGSYIWLHKQPLFLWQIALSFKIFGVSLLSLRLPSVVMSTLLIPLFYRMAHLLTNRRDIAYFTGLAVAASWYLVQLTSGMMSTDHNDVCFLFYVSASVWAFMEYVHRGRKQLGWALLAGGLAGCAILTKWLVGLLLYLVWGCYLLFEYGFRLRQWKWGHLFAALCVTLLIAVPWQVYCLHQFPDIARQELFYNMQHFDTTVEDHAGKATFYLMVLPMHYFGRGPVHYNIRFVWDFHTILCYVVLAIGLVLSIHAARTRSHHLTLVSVLLFVCLFFSLATTKMPSFTFVICFIGFMAIGCVLSALDRFLQQLVHHKTFRALLTAVLCVAFCLYSTNCRNFYKETMPLYFQLFKDNVECYKRWEKELPENCMVFCVKSPSLSKEDYTSCISAMFYSNRQCYTELPPMSVLHELQEAGKTIAVVKNPWSVDADLDSTVVWVDMK